jgi:hypothetical protein
MNTNPQRKRLKPHLFNHNSVCNCAYYFHQLFENWNSFLCEDFVGRIIESYAHILGKGDILSSPSVRIMQQPYWNSSCIWFIPHFMAGFLLQYTCLGTHWIGRVHHCQKRKDQCAKCTESLSPSLYPLTEILNLYVWKSSCFNEFFLTQNKIFILMITFTAAPWNPFCHEKYRPNPYEGKILLVK